MKQPLIKALKIDVEKQSIYEIEIVNNLEAKYEAIGNDCRLIEIGAFLPHNNILRQCRDAMYVDEEALLKCPTRDDVYNLGIFKLALSPRNLPHFQPEQKVIHTFVGNAIIVGTSDDGDSESHNISLKDLHERFMGFYRTGS
jgi:hypothetical protein